MLSNEQQKSSLALVAEKVGAAVCNFVICENPGDVIYLSAPVPHASEIVSAERMGEYDVWKDGTIVKADVDRDTAAKVVIAEYKANKINIVMSRVVGKNWSAKKNQPEVASILSEVTYEVMDIEREKARSQKAKANRDVHDDSNG